MAKCVDMLWLPHSKVVATMLRECSKETVGREARACMRRLEFVLHQSRPNFTSLNHRNSTVCAWQEHEHTHAHINGQAEKVMPSILPLSLSISKRTSPATQLSFRQNCRILMRS